MYICKQLKHANTIDAGAVKTKWPIVFSSCNLTRLRALQMLDVIKEYISCRRFATNLISKKAVSAPDKFSPSINALPRTACFPKLDTGRRAQKFDNTHAA
jgi:hypothetical protein